MPLVLSGILYLLLYNEYRTHANFLFKNCFLNLRTMVHLTQNRSLEYGKCRQNSVKRINFRHTTVLYKRRSLICDILISPKNRVGGTGGARGACA